MANLRTRNNAACKKYRDSHKKERYLTCLSWSKLNHDKVRQYSKTFESLHPDRHKKDPDKLKEYRRNARINFRSKPGGKLNHAVSFAVWRSLKSGVKAGRKWESLMGYTLAQLMHHLEKQFTSEMSWENYGLYWHVDHKIPITAFNFLTAEDLEFKQCWDLDNLQPLEKIANIKKSNHIPSY